MPVALEQFVKQLADSGVLAPGKLENFVPPKAQPKDTQELIQQLVKSKQLTKFQAQEVYQGRAKSLSLGNYVILDKIGVGGMGQVFKAQHRRMDRIVAIKMLPNDVTKVAANIARFEREVKAAARLSHPNIVAAYDADEANGVHFFAMEFVDGSDLAALVKKNGPFSTQKAVNCILQAAKGLEFAHGEGVIHRDIKPANLLLDKKGTVKILDMGLARVQPAADAATQAELTGTGAVMGTVDYMAPEQAVDTKQADARADIYSLGCTFYYLLAGKATYDGHTLMAKLLAHREQPIPALGADVPEEVEAVFQKMIAKSVDDRYQTMSEVVADLEQFASGQPTSLSIQQTLGSESSADVMTFLKDVTLNMTHKPKHTKKRPAVKTGKNEQLIILIVGGAVLAVAIVAALIFKLQTKDGTLTVEINQPDATVQVLNAEGKTEVMRPGEKGLMSISIDPGNHRLKVQKEGFQPFTQDFTIESGDTRSIKAMLEPVKVAVAASQPNKTSKKPDVGELNKTDPTSADKLTATQPVPPPAIDPVPATQPALPPVIDPAPATQPPATATAGPDPAPMPALAPMAEPPVAKDSRIPIPDSATRITAEKQYQELFHADLAQAKQPEQKSALADKLLGQAEATQNDPAARYIMLQEALRLGTELADVAILERAIKSLSGAYVVDASELWIDALEKAAQKSRLPNLSKRLVDVALDHVDEAAADDNYELAARFQSAALAAAQKAREPALQRNVVERGKILAAAKQQRNTAQQAAAVLAKSPDDAAANLTLGKYLCLTKGDWDQGFARLAKGSDPVLSSLASQSLANPSDPAAQEKLGDIWWKAAETARASSKAELLQLGSVFWYSKALPRLTGLAKSNVERRLQSLPAPSPSTIRLAYKKWMKDLAALPAEQQVDAVAKKLQELNPEFDGKQTHKIETGVLTELSFLSDNVTDISPVRALTRLKKLTCKGSDFGKGRLSDLSQLTGMPLTDLNVNNCTQIKDLTPLKGMPLESLSIWGWSGSDLSPLKGMPLKSLNCGGGRQALDLTPLAGLPLTYLCVNITEVSDLKPLKDMPLTNLECSNTRVSDLSPLRGMALEGLHVEMCKVADLAPIKGMPVKVLVIDKTFVSDLRPLRGMPLEDIRLTPKNITQGLEILRDVPSLKKIGIDDSKQVWPTADFWTRYDKGEFKD